MIGVLVTLIIQLISTCRCNAACRAMQSHAAARAIKLHTRIKLITLQLLVVESFCSVSIEKYIQLVSNNYGQKISFLQAAPIHFSYCSE